MTTNDIRESYSFQYSREELSELTNLIFKDNGTRLIIVTFLWIGLMVLSMVQPDMMVWFFILGFFFIRHILRIKEFFSNKKAWKNEEERVAQTTYAYDVYQDSFRVKIYRDEELKKEETITFSDLKEISEVGKYLLLQTVNESFIIRKADLISNSIVYAEYWERRVKAVPQKATGLWQWVSNVLFVASILSIWGALYGMTLLPDQNTVIWDKEWMFFCFLPIPIASIIVGLHLKKKGVKYKKNIVVGIVMTIFLCLLGVPSLSSKDVYIHDEAPLLVVEEYTQVNIPEAKQINTVEWNQSVAGTYVFYDTRVYFEEEKVSEFETLLQEDKRWISEIPTQLVGILSPMGTREGYQYFMIYNIDTEEYNTLPSEKGTYHFIQVFYSIEDKGMRIAEYRVEFVK